MIEILHLISSYLKEYIGSYFDMYNHIFFVVGIIQLILSRYNFSLIYTALILPILALIYEFWRFQSDDIRLMVSIIYISTNILSYLNDYKDKVFYAFISIFFSTIISLYFASTYSELYLYMTLYVVCVMAILMITNTEENINHILENATFYIIAISFISAYSAYYSAVTNGNKIININHEDCKASLSLANSLLFLSLSIFTSTWPFGFLIIKQNKLISPVASIISPIQIALFSLITIKIFHGCDILRIGGSAMIIYGVIYGMLNSKIRSCFIYISMIQYGYLLAFSSTIDLSKYAYYYIFSQISVYFFISLIERKFDLKYFYNFTSKKKIDILNFLILIISIFAFLTFPLILIVKTIFDGNYLNQYDYFYKAIMLSSIIFSYAMIPWKKIFSVKIIYKLHLSNLMLAELFILIFMLSKSISYAINSIELSLMQYYILIITSGIYLGILCDHLKHKVILLDMNWLYKNIYIHKFVNLGISYLKKIHFNPKLKWKILQKLNLSYSVGIIFIVLAALLSFIR